MLSHLERDVVRRTMRAQQLLLLQKPRTANSPLKFLQQPQIVQSSQQNPSKTARIQQPSQQDQDRYIAASMASGIPILDQQLNQRSAGQALTQVVYTTRR
jgi:hypothetical protein